MQQLRKGNRQRANLGVSFLQHIYVSGVRGQRYGYVSPLFFTRKAVQLKQKTAENKTGELLCSPVFNKRLSVFAEKEQRQRAGTAVRPYYRVDVMRHKLLYLHLFGNFVFKKLRILYAVAVTDKHNLFFGIFNGFRHFVHHCRYGFFATEHLVRRSQTPLVVAVHDRLDVEYACKQIACGLDSAALEKPIQVLNGKPMRQTQLVFSSQSLTSSIDCPFSLRVHA